MQLAMMIWFQLVFPNLGVVRYDEDLQRTGSQDGRHQDVQCHNLAVPQFGSVPWVMDHKNCSQKVQWSFDEYLSKGSVNFQ